VRYNDKRPWPISPDGGGPSLELINPFDDYTSAGAWRAAVSNSFSTTWTRYSVVGIPSSTTVYFYLDGAGDCLIDDIELRATSNPVTNYVQNGGFETAAPLQWTATGSHAGSGRVTTDAHTGAACMKVVASSSGGQFSGQVVGTCPGIALSSGSYTLSFWSKGLRPGVVLRVGMRGGAGSAWAPATGQSITNRVIRPGSYQYNAGTETYTVGAGGTDIEGTTDHFYFANGPLTGDGVLEATVGKVANSSITGAIGGVMIRDTADYRSAYVCCLLRWDNNVSLYYRSTFNTGQIRVTGPNVPGPVTLRITRAGNTFLAEADPGTGFSAIGSVQATMGPSAMVGFAVAPYDTTAPYDEMTTYTFAQPVSGGADFFAEVSVPEFFATPGAVNSRYSANVPPYIHNVDTFPDFPTSANPIQVRALITDADGITSVRVSYQIVPPGAYIRLGDPAYQTNWTALAMTPSSTPSVYVATIPAQPHRTLVRYRISAQDGAGQVTTVPYSDDSEPNYGRFVYNGVPPYVASRQPGVTGMTPHTVLTKVPVLHLIANDADTSEAQSIPIPDHVERRQFKWYGTVVFNGKVYDHIRFRMRGGTWRYRYNKRMWKLRFNRGHYLEFVRNDGTRFEEDLRTLNMMACNQPPGNVPSWVETARGDGSQRGESGIVDRSCYWLLKQVGAIAAEASWIHFRVVDDASEAGVDPNPAGPDESQYYGDFFGLYLGVQGMDEDVLTMNGRPVGNFYKMDDWGQLPSQPPWFVEARNCVQPTDDINQFIAGYSANPAPTWWEQNVDLESYYSARAVVDCAHHGDMVGGKNWYYYHNPVTNKWELAPWDFDLTFGTDFGDAHMPFRDRLLVRNVGPPFDAAPNAHPEFEYIDIAYRNRLREVIQLLYTSEKFFPVLDQWRNLIVEIATADMYRWDWAPYTIDNTNWDRRNTQRGGYEPLDVRLGDLKIWIGDRVRYLTSPRRAWTGRTEWADPPYSKETGWPTSWWDFTCYDANIPATPTLTAPANGASFSRQQALVLNSSAFSDPNGSAHAASKWILTQVGGNELKPDWSSGIAPMNLTSMSVPTSQLDAGDYWIRVRHMDNTGRWSWWSRPVTVTLTAATSQVEHWQAY
jgi:hypothetical protein